LNCEHGLHWPASPFYGKICKTWQSEFNVCIGTAMVEPEGDILTLDEVAAYLKAGKRTIYRLAASGEIPAFKLGGTWRFRKADLEWWIASRTGETAFDDERGGKVVTTTAATPSKSALPAKEKR
jgi:excisionase family DNA binding protein